jgi:two-component system, cell cycle sensor histidine kinase and response regulator CckA
MAAGRQHKRRASDTQAGRFEKARLALARLHGGSAETLLQMWLQVAQLAADTLKVERIGVWLLMDENRAIRCRYLLQHSNEEVFQGAVLRKQDFPAYFAGLAVHRCVAVDDAQGSPASSELREAYLQPLGITSMVDAPLFINGKLVGVVCHEHVGPARHWSDAEADFACAVADNIARLYVEYQQSNVQATLETYQRHLLELHRMEAVGRMAAGIAHDFRGIIGAAMGFAELIRRAPGVSLQVDQYAAKILDALERGRRLSNEVMNFGKDEVVTPRVLDACEVLDNMSDMLRVLLGSTITLTITAGAQVSRIFIDASQLERMVLNLALNARDAMPEGGQLRITIEDTRIENEDAESAIFVVISVQDTGTGMDAGTLEHIFKPFFTTKGEAGTGLGLVIVQQVVARAGGFIRMTSEPGQGTTASAYLPRIAAAQLVQGA